MERLTDEQASILRTAESGHNLLITGQAGTGKTYLVKRIFNRLKECGKNVAIICSSGVSATVYADLKTTVYTVHSFYGLGTADLPWNLVVDRALANNLVCERVNSVDVIIWDEISMSSSRIFELANAIHNRLSESPVPKPFGGKQVVVVGEFLQLRPVPNVFDEGKFSFESKVFTLAIPHRFQLKKILRQESTPFIDCLKEIRLGSCSEASYRFLQGLQRDLDVHLEQTATHIYFRKLSAQVHNMNKLNELSGDLERFDAVDEGRTKRLQCPAEDVLFLKKDCKVMLIWNKSDKLRNGTPGIYRGISDNKLIVDFDNVGRVLVKREVWQTRSRTGEIVACRKQFPLMLMYAVTCHKSQGLTLPAAIVHCSKEFVSGLIYVALTRVRHEEHLQVKNFHPRQLLPPSPECVNVCESDIKVNTNIDTFECCREHVMQVDDLTVSDATISLLEADEEFVPDDTLETTERILSSYYERGEPSEQVIDLETVYVVLQEDTNEIISRPSQDFDVIELLQSIKAPDPITPSAMAKNNTIDDLISNPQLEVFGNILWSRACQILIEDSLLNLEEIQVSSTQWTVDTRQLFLLITRSPDFMRDIQLIFSTEKPEHIHLVICSELMKLVYKKVVAKIVEIVKEEELQASIVLDISEMPVEGLGKIRYVGAWAVRKVFNHNLKYVKNNYTSSVDSTRASVKEKHLMSELLEECIIAKFENLVSHSKYPDTLCATEDRQYRSRGLFHIEDQSYEFFLAMESLRITHVNEKSLKIHKEALIDYSLATLSADSNLYQKWRVCFPDDVVSSEEQAIQKLFHEVVHRFVMVGAGQYMKDYRLAHRLKKSAEHRKKVLQKKQQLEEKKNAISISDIMADRSTGKSASHYRLLNYISKYGRKAFTSIFKKSELQLLCKAYGVKYKASSNKGKLVQDLIQVLESSERIPYSCFVTPLESNITVDDEQHQLGMTITIARQQ